MSDKLKQKTCIECFFFRAIPKTDILGEHVGEDEDFGECHRYAPRQLCGSGTGFSNDKWPHLQKDDWCGEFQIKEQ